MQTEFFTTDADDYPGVSDVPLKLIFPNPLTVQHYVDFQRALVPLEDGDVDRKFCLYAFVSCSNGRFYPR